ncbi:MAG: tetratricopeptide repeat protein [Bryobacterales bacterium]|nr:tetratricopeptide repeat protein [Bryobacterales bacterium]
MRMGPGSQSTEISLPEGIAPEPVRAQLDRILASKIFLASDRMARLLRFLVESALQGRSHQLKEYLLGVEVFDRGESFDPRTDPIVRVEARRLRTKLKDYYKDEGCNDRLRIEVPTGGYLPRFAWQGAAPQRDVLKDRATPEGAAASASIAVLPFANLSPEADAEYFSDGLTEEIIHALTKVEGLTVVAWQSAAKLKASQTDVSEVAARLRVATVLQGSVRRAAGQVRILAKLIEADTGRIAWSDTYDRQMDDLFVIQEDIARRVADSLRLKLLGVKEPRLQVRPWKLPTYDLYLRGRFHWNKRTLEGFQRALECFSDAVARDPEFAPGHVGLADTHSLMVDHGLIAPRDGMPLAKASALRALQLDSGLAEAYTSLGFIASAYEWNWEQAEKYYLHSLGIQPGYATTYHWYACDLLALTGRFEEAREVMRVALRLDPLSPVMMSSAGYIELLAGRMDAALAAIEQALELDPGFFKAIATMGRVHIHRGEYAQAVAILEKAREVGGNVPTLLGALTQAYGFHGERGAARAVLAKMNALATARYVPCTSFAMAHIGLGENDRAIEWLELGCERREASVCALAVHPGYEPVRGEQRVLALLRAMGLEKASGGRG